MAGVPSIVARPGSGTIVSPWEPSVIASTSRAARTPQRSARKKRRRAESRSPAMPTTRSAREAGDAPGEVRHLVERVRHHDEDANGERGGRRADAGTHDRGVRAQEVGAALARLRAGGPAVITTTSEFAVAA